MLWLRIFIFGIGLLLGVYYLMLVIQLLSNGNFRFTNRRLTFGRCILPFYYWIATQNEPVKVKRTGRVNERLASQFQELENSRNIKETEKN